MWFWFSRVFIPLFYPVCFSRSVVSLCHPTYCSLPDSSVHGILQARILEQVAMSSSTGSSQPKTWTQVSLVAEGFFTIWTPPGKPYLVAVAKPLQLCPILCKLIDGTPPGSSFPGILQARPLEWVAISFSNAWKWKVKVKLFSRVRLFATPRTAAYQAPQSMGFFQARVLDWVAIAFSDLIARRSEIRGRYLEVNS